MHLQAVVEYRRPPIQPVVEVTHPGQLGYAHSRQVAVGVVRLPDRLASRVRDGHQPAQRVVPRRWLALYPYVGMPTSGSVTPDRLP